MAMSVAFVPTHVRVLRLLQRAALRGSLHLVQFSNWVLYTRKGTGTGTNRCVCLSLSLSPLSIKSTTLQTPILFQQKHHQRRYTIPTRLEFLPSPPLPCPTLPRIISIISHLIIRPSWSCTIAQGFTVVFLPFFLPSFLPSFLSSFLPFSLPSFLSSSFPSLLSSFLPFSSANSLLPHYRTSISTAPFRV